jgi:hypothetical protein
VTAWLVITQVKQQIQRQPPIQKLGEELSPLRKGEYDHLCTNGFYRHSLVFLPPIALQIESKLNLLGWEE